MGGQPPKGEVIGVFEIVFAGPSGECTSITVAGEHGTGHFRLPPSDYLAKGKKVVLSITEYVESGS